MEVGGRSWTLVDVGERWWAVVVVGRQSLSLVGDRGRWWAVVDVGGWSWSFVGARGRWWAVVDDRWWAVVVVDGRSWTLVGARGRSWSSVGVPLRPWSTAHVFICGRPRLLGGRRGPRGKTNTTNDDRCRRSSFGCHVASVGHHLVTIVLAKGRGGHS